MLNQSLQLPTDYLYAPDIAEDTASPNLCTFSDVQKYLLRTFQIPQNYTPQFFNTKFHLPRIHCKTLTNTRIDSQLVELQLHLHSLTLARYIRSDCTRMERKSDTRCANRVSQDFPASTAKKYAFMILNDFFSRELDMR